VECVFVHDRFAVAQLRQASIPSEFIRFARDPLIHGDGPNNAATTDSSSPRDRIVFIGNPDRERIRYLRALIDLGLGIYGQWEWARLSPQDPLAQCVRGGVQLGAAMVQRMRAARLSVNILRHCQKTAHNMRTFEIPACGACTLSEASVGVQELFAPGREIAVFRTPEELRATARELLDSPSTVDSIARAGRARVEHETYTERGAELLSTL
jgi:glycosyltransferase involved in cell wall biosynthesis